MNLQVALTDINGRDLLITYIRTNDGLEFNVFKYMNKYNYSNRTKIMAIKNENCKIIYNIKHEAIWMNTHAFFTYFMSSSLPDSEHVRDWIFHFYRFVAPVGRPKYMPSTTKNDITITQSNLKSPEEVWNKMNDKSSAYYRMYKDARKKWLEEGCELFELPYTIEAIKVILLFLFSAKRMKIKSDNNTTVSTMNGFTLFRQLIEDIPNAKYKIQHELIQKYQTLKIGRAHV